LIENVLTERDHGEKENARPDVLDYGRPDFHPRELSGEYSGFPHLELGWLEDSRSKRRESETQDAASNTHQGPHSYRPARGDQASSFLHSVTYQDSKEFENAVRGANFRRSDECSDLKCVCVK
jgi:hypothetical protein